MTYYSKSKQHLIELLKNPNISKEDKSKYMSILTWIQEKENKENLKEEKLNEIALRLHKKFQSGLELK